jgi:thioredoxin-dependent peroxiredoxin
MPEERDNAEQAARLAVIVIDCQPAATPFARPVRAARRAWAQGGKSLLLMAAGLACGFSTACSQSPKGSGDAPKAEATAPAAAEGSPATPAPARDADGLLVVGTAAPDVQGTDPKGQPIKLSERKGHVSIVYFYPKDGTPGCTKEACAFRDTFDKFNQRDVTIFGVSRDDEASHAKFRAEHSLPFPLVADPSGAVQKSYGVPDKIPGLASRVTFLVAADGRIAKVWPDVDPAVHADEVFRAIEQLK